MSADLTPADAQLRLRSLTYVVGSLAAGDVLVGLVSLMVLPPMPFDATALLVCLAVGAIGGLVAFGLQPTLVHPVPRESPTPLADGLARLSSVTMVQASVASASGMALFALAFAFELHPLSVSAGLFVAAAAVLAVAWPAAGRLRRVNTQLERSGARVGLDELRR